MLRRTLSLKCSSLTHPPILGGTVANVGAKPSFAISPTALVVPGGLKVQWGFRTYRNGTVPMGDSDSKKLEALFAKMVNSGKASLLEEKVSLSNGHAYNFFFTEKQSSQVNIDSKKQRRLARRLVPETTAPPVVKVTGSRGTATRKAKAKAPSVPVAMRSIPNLGAVQETLKSVSKGDHTSLTNLVDSGLYVRRFHHSWDRFFPANCLLSASRAVGGRVPSGLPALAEAEFVAVKNATASRILDSLPKKTQSEVRRGGTLTTAHVSHGVERLQQYRIARMGRVYSTGGRDLALVQCIRTGFANLWCKARRGAYDAIVTNDPSSSGAKLVTFLKTKRLGPSRRSKKSSSKSKK